MYEIQISATIHKEEDWYVSWCPELDVASQGKTVEETLDNLREAVELVRRSKLTYGEFMALL
ncbi:type II toxin-antitoxin system HicB family antitoxin [uncultured Methanolobus sp.]|uniref:type II toxin-antitoxin system HicB family antitoxin n=1 Tax=uncultured Methanolobus sp. TaxID=218300 RepID=UPI002AAB8C6D|nr:type II toxin-antitoxin system HicB family antitoxin [uncultured Methanolobus sp.]